MIDNGRRIFKYPLQLTERQTISLPTNGQIKSVQVQRGVICLWVLCNKHDSSADRHIAIYGTGNPMPDDPMSFVGTVQVDEFVWHVFEAFAS